VVELQAVLYWGMSKHHLTHAVRIDLTEPLPAGSSPTVGVIGALPAPLTSNDRRPSASLAQPEIAELLRRAETLLQSGDFESARLIYSALADDGLAQAAMLMARTFDPEVLKDRFIVGMSPDAEKAKHWYRRAMALGDDGARRRLDLLARQDRAPP
jgi:TPR repeat protein